MQDLLDFHGAGGVKEDGGQGSLIFFFLFFFFFEKGL